ncbi:FecR family protein [Echinicola shivajiensis]|uniref:FecR family protein n=1 Tax=Echinicola shivajiensis TaxID=1035916 RepID=UPI001BFCB251|nr:FecR domain-containing protein [Echinicola shivajiensis]
MNKETFELASLIEKFLLKKTSPEEENRMHSLLQKKEHKDLLEYYRGAEKVQLKLDYMQSLDVDKAWGNVKKRNKKNTSHHFFNLKYAAVLIFGLLALGYVLLSQNYGFIKWDEEGVEYSSAVHSDQIILSLSSNKEIPLTADFIKIQDGENVLIEGNEQGISFSLLNSDVKSEVLYQLRVPAKKVLGVSLTDGSQVWVNAQSSLSFNPQFSKEQRKVKLRGEAFFDVKHDPSKPFIVEAENSEVKVLGTKFNVKSSVEKTTTVLLEGKVEFSQNDQNEILRPGEGATADGSKLKKVTVDMDEVMAWKNGVFLFEKSALSEVLDEVGRWYGFEISGAIDELKGKRFSGKIKRDTPIDQVLMIIQDVCPVNIQLKERVLEVSVNR